MAPFQQASLFALLRLALEELVINHRFPSGPLFKALLSRVRTWFCVGVTRRTGGAWAADRVERVVRRMSPWPALSKAHLGPVPAGPGLWHPGWVHHGQNSPDHCRSQGRQCRGPEPAVHRAGDAGLLHLRGLRLPAGPAL